MSSSQILCDEILEAQTTKEVGWQDQKDGVSSLPHA